MNNQPENLTPDTGEEIQNEANEPDTASECDTPEEEFLENGNGEVDGDGAAVCKESGVYKATKSYFDIVEILTFAIVAVLVIFSCFFRICKVDGRSMNNTLYDGETLIVSDFFYDPKPGDIVVFHLVNNSYQQPLVKRVIATEGQSVSLDFITGELFVDGVLIEEDYAYVDNGGMYFIKNDYDAKCISYNDEGHSVFNATVPEGKVFVMGDNRNHSTDSRSILVGFVDENCILGKALIRLSPYTVFK